MKFTPVTQTTQRQFEAEVAPGGFGVQVKARPRLTAQWIVAEDGKLTCQWTL